MDFPTLKTGGEIKIKKENRGKFTKYCGGKVTSECIKKGKNSPDPKIRKRAIFAENARTWKYQTGGKISLHPYSVANLINGIYNSSRLEEFLGKPWHNYDFALSKKEADSLGFYPDSRGHKSDAVKKESHPKRGKWYGNFFELTDFGMENPNHTIFGLNDGNQDPQAIVTYKKGIVIPEITVTPNGNYTVNTYDNIKILPKLNFKK